MDELTRLTTESPIDKQESNKVVIYNRACRFPAEMETRLLLATNSSPKPKRAEVRVGGSGDRTGKRIKAQRDETIQVRSMNRIQLLLIP